MAEYKGNKKILVAVISGLILIYLAVIIIIPLFCTEYQLFYVTGELSEWPGEGGLPFQTGQTAYFDKEHKELQSQRLGTGWAARENGFTWSVGTESTVQFQFNEEQDLIFDIETGALMCESYNVYVNDTLIGSSSEAYNDHLIVTAPSSAFEAGRLCTVRFDIQNPTRPCDVNPASSDERELGLQLKSITVLQGTDRNKCLTRITDENPQPEYELGEKVYFGSKMSDSNSNRRGKGWSHREDDFCWTEGTRADVYFLCEEQPSGLILDVGDMLCSSYDILVNDIELETGITYSTGEARYELPQSVSAGYLKLTLVINDPVQPSASGDSQDSRWLGIQVRSVTME